MIDGYNDGQMDEHQPKMWSEKNPFKRKAQLNQKIKDWSYSLRRGRRLMSSEGKFWIWTSGL